MNIIRIAQNLHIETGDIVYQYIDRSLEMVYGLLGIMCAGGVYCPVDPTDSPRYIRKLIEETQGHYVLVHQNTRDRFSSFITGKIQMIQLEHILLADITDDVEQKELYVDSDSPSYIICTSGVNDERKIVVHTHRSLVTAVRNLMRWNNKHGDRILQITPVSSFIHLSEILMPLVTIPLGTLVLLPPEDNSDMYRFCKTIKDKQITILFLNPSLLEMLLNYLERNNTRCHETFERVRILWILGKSLNVQHLAQVKSFSSQTRTILIFGMNETNVALCHEIEETIDELNDLNILPMGRALGEYRYMLIDESKNGQVILPLETNRMGQIYLTGPGLFQGYYNNSELTRSTRVIIDNEAFFKTGALARYNINGELVHVGCIDSQLKMNHYRIDTAEIAKIIQAYSPNEIDQCVVVQSSQNKDLTVAYIISNNSQLNTEIIRKYCKDYLPEYMIPFYFIILDEFPVDTNGEVELPLPSLLNIQSVAVNDLVPGINVSHPGRTIYKGTCRYWSSLPSISLEPSSNNHLSTTKRYVHTSLPTSIHVANNEQSINETNHILNQHHLSNSSDLEEKRENQLPFQGFIEKAFYCFRQTTPLRYQCLKLITWPWFERIVILVILLNCIILAMYEPCPDDTNSIGSPKKCNTRLCFCLQVVDYFIFVFFTIEMCIKMMAMGVIGKGTYLADSWNRLDCFIVIAGLVELAIPGDHLSLSAIRTVRVLRPLRAINRIPSMRILVMLLLDTLPMLGNLLFLCFLIFFAFGVIGVQLWKGLLRNRCFLQLNTTITLFDDFPTQPYYVPSDEDSFICSNLLSNGMTKCSEIPPYRRDNMTCQLDLYSLNSLSVLNGCINWNQYYQLCTISDQNPFSGSISFDNIGLAWIAIFQIITLENWSSIMYYIQDAHSFWNWIYFVCLIVIGSFLMMNLCLVVIATQFSVTKKRETERMLTEQKRFLSSTTINQRGNCWTEAIKYLERLINRGCQQFRKLWKNDQINGQVKITTNALIESEINTVSSIPLINQKHRIERDDQEITSRYINCCSCFRKPLRRFVLSKYFEYIIFSAVILNTLFMAMEYHGQPQSLTNALEYINHFFIILFTIEMLLKLIAHGFFGYIKDLFNIFDGGIVIVSLVELYATKHSGLSVLRTFRLLRILKLVRFMPTLRRQLIVMIKTLDSVATFLLLLSLVIFIFSILGIHLFGGKFCTIKGFNLTSREQIDITCQCCTCLEWTILQNSTDLKDLTCIQERANFDSFRSALLTVFQILTQEDWNEVLYNGMEKTSAWSTIYFIALMIFGNYILLNLLVAILVEGFTNYADDDTTKSNKIDPFETQAIITGNIQIPESVDLSTGIKLRRDSHSSFTDYHGGLLEQEPIKRQLTNDKTSRKQHENDEYVESSIHSTIQINMDSQTLVDESNDMQLYVLTERELITQQSKRNQCCGARIPECLKKREDYSLSFFSPSNKLRKAFQRLILQKPFDYLILFFITFNCITLAMERPSISPTSVERQFLNYTNYIFTTIFTIEMLIKIIACGLISGRNTYLRNAWNIMDGFLVITSIIDLCIINRDSVGSHILGMLRVFRLLRALRPLRVINRAPGLQLVVQTLLSSLKSIGHIVLICCIFFVIFGLLGVQLFKGEFYYCEGPLAQNISTRHECEAMSDHRWENQQFNFDNLFQALLTLFVLSTKDGWVEIMYHGIDAVNVDKQPKENYNQWKSIYFIAFILIVGFFIVNMFVGVIIENFQNCRAQQELEEGQNKAKHEKKIKQQQKRLRQASIISVNFSSWRKYLYDLCTNKYFDLIITIMIGINLLTMSFEYYKMPSTLETFIEYCNYIFTIIFIIEFLWKFLAFGPWRYFKNKWNQLDAFIVLLSVVGIVMEKMQHGNVLPIKPTVIRMMRIFRIARVLRLLKTAKGVQVLLDTVMQALPQVGNLVLLFFLIFFIFAALGVELFGKILCNEEYPCNGLDKHAHFKNFGMALLILFRVATGDNWNSIMKDTLRQDDTSHMAIISPVYFVLFVLLAQYVLVNIVLAVLMKNFENSNKIAEEDEENQ